MKCMKKYADGGAWPPRNKMDKSCRGSQPWHGGDKNYQGTSRSYQRAGTLSSKPVLDKNRLVKPEKPKKDRITRAERKSAELNKFANPRFL